MPDLCHMLHIQCIVSHVVCHIAYVTCLVSHVIYFILLLFGQSCGPRWWRVCYQQGLSHLFFFLAFSALAQILLLDQILH